jgi:hypothetical protein
MLTSLYSKEFKMNKAQLLQKLAKAGASDLLTSQDPTTGEAEPNYAMFAAIGAVLIACCCSCSSAIGGLIYYNRKKESFADIDDERTINWRFIIFAILAIALGIYLYKNKAKFF